MLINLVQTVAVEDLKKEVEGRYKLSKESIVRESKWNIEPHDFVY